MSQLIENKVDYVSDVRGFNRFYTQKIGVLHEGHLDSPFSLTEVRVLYELAHLGSCTASQMNKTLELDPGYLSRLLRSFEKRGFVQKTNSEVDARSSLVQLTEAGKSAFQLLNDRSTTEVNALLSNLTEDKQKKLVDAMNTIKSLLAENTSAQAREPYMLRSHQIGDMGWIVHRQGVLYAEEYGWNEKFEGLVAEIVAKFIQNFDPKYERCWIAEMNEEIVGSIFVVKENDTTAKLRLLYVEPKARGLGIGERLVRECMRFAKQAGYKKMVLWTNNVLGAARKLYERAGFKLVEESTHSQFGTEVVGQYWEVDL